ncbi:MAG: MbnP family protein, partial [Candidatus Latescibacterota bacterium]|nr:MbnP family protein [Candidatus Latescibacterota bacterium]
MKWVLPFALLLLTSCGDDHDMADVTVSFRHVVEESPLVLNQVDYGNEVGESYNVTRLEYILTDSVLMRDEGTSVNVRDVFYVRVP